MMTDAKAVAIITDGRSEPPVDWNASAIAGPTILFNPDSEPEPDPGPGPEPGPGQSGDLDKPGEPDALDGANPAYLIYTSGSTGTPNGVVVNHDNLAHSNAARIAHYGQAPAAYLLLSSVAFDSSVAGLFWTLSTGGRLVLPEAGRELDIAHLAAAIATNEVTHTLCLPSLYRLLLDHADPMALQTLSTVIVAGETCPGDLVRRHHALLPAAELHNEYGPTEATVWCTVHRCRPRHHEGAALVPIGRPIPGSVVTLVDGGGNPVPPGMPGRLTVGGPGVTHGYLDRPEANAQRFDERHGRRWFATGDLGRYRTDGTIDFLGRDDDQIKIRGVRIETGEIEASLDAHPGVARSAVTVAEDPLGPYLVATVEPVALDGPGFDPAGFDPAGFDTDELRRYLAGRLPDPYVPSRIVAVERLAVLPNGKVDRAKVAPVTRAADNRPRTAPRDELERVVATVWNDLLPDADPGIHDDFFEIGGHSLLAVTLVERLRSAISAASETLGIEGLDRNRAELRLGDLLAAPTIAAQADLFRADNEPTTWRSLSVVKPDGDRPPLFLVPPAAGTALSFRELSRHLDPGQPVYSFEPLGADGETEPHQTVDEMAELYLSELLQARPDGPIILGGSCLGALVAWEMACKLDRAGTPVDRLLLLDPGPPRNGPTWTTKSVDSRSKGELVLMAFRHAVRGTLPKVLGALRKRRRYSAIRQMHQRAQRTYTAAALPDVDLVLFQSAELASKPHVIERWRALAGDDLAPIVLPATTHDGLMNGEVDQVSRMATLIDQSLVDVGIDSSADIGAETGAGAAGVTR
jgi:amino acid adenylation domain-containing protein